MTRTECEQKIKELMIQIRDIAREHDPRIGREIGLGLSIWPDYSWMTALEPDESETVEIKYVLDYAFHTDEGKDGEDDDA